MAKLLELPLPMIDALPLGAHRLLMLTDERLFKACGVRIAFAGRQGGASEGAYSSLNCSAYIGDLEASVERNLELACEAIGADRTMLISARQVHGTRFVRARSVGELADAQADAERGADGIMVDVPGVSALIVTADCLPLVVVSPSGRFVVAHAGWRGAVAHIARLAAEALAQDDRYEPSAFNAYIGPHICSDCFEVGEEVVERFEGEFGSQAHVDDRHVSLANAVATDLMESGLCPERIADAGCCTKCDPSRFFSYRATGGECGRNGTFAYRMP